MWGEVIPLYFTLGATGLNKTTKVVVLSQPSRRYNHSIEMIGELTKLGQDMHVYLSSIRERIAIIVSGDLAHTHLKSGPYGYSSAAEPFDKVSISESRLLYLILSVAFRHVDIGPLR